MGALCGASSDCNINLPAVHPPCRFGLERWSTPPTWETKLPSGSSLRCKACTTRCLSVSDRQPPTPTVNFSRHVNFGFGHCCMHVSKFMFPVLLCKGLFLAPTLCMWVCADCLVIGEQMVCGWTCQRLPTSAQEWCVRSPVTTRRPCGVSADD